MAVTAINGSVDVHHLDLDALIDEAKAQGTPFTFTFGGEEYDLGTHMDVRAGTLMSEGKIDEAMQLLLGAEQWERMKASPQLLPPGAFVAIFRGFAAHSGVELPNLSDSAGSSPSTAEPSKPTYSATTESP